MFYYFHKKNYNVVLLQETHSHNKIETRWRAESGAKLWFSHGTSQARGVAIWVRKNFDLKPLEVRRDEEGRFILLRAEVEKEKMLFVCLYGPNIDDLQFYINAFRKVEETGVDRKIIGGDFNTVLDYERDRSNKMRHRNQKASDAVNDVIENLDLADVWRVKNGEKTGYTWRKKQPFLAERLDYILVKESMMQFVKTIEVIPGYKSDYSQVVLDINYIISQRGPGFWRLNKSLLSDKEYVEKINRLIEIKMNQTHLYKTKKQHWEIIKLMIRNSTLQYSAKKKRSRENTLEVLERKYSYWKKEGNKGIFDKVENRLLELKRDIEKIYMIKTQGAVLRYRANLAEKPTKYFLNLEKSNYNKKTIHSLQTKERQITDPKEIRTEITKFYKTLYTSKVNPSKKWLENLETPTLNSEMQETIAREITIEEISQALKELKNGKVGGVDGIPTDFYKVFWLKLKEFFHSLILEIQEDGVLHLSARRGIISLLEKENENLLKVDSFRPISLLCADYKIFAKLLATRLQKVLIVLIHESQTACLKGRNIAESTMKMLTLIDYCEANSQSCVVISIDFKKAFDLVEWKAIEFTLEKFKFPKKFINLVKILYTDIYSCVINNGYIGEWF